MGAQAQSPQGTRRAFLHGHSSDVEATRDVALWRNMWFGDRRGVGARELAQSAKKAWCGNGSRRATVPFVHTNRCSADAIFARTHVPFALLLGRSVIYGQRFMSVTTCCSLCTF